MIGADGSLWTPFDRVVSTALEELEREGFELSGRLDRPLASCVPCCFRACYLSLIAQVRNLSHVLPEIRRLRSSCDDH
jgi:hypothetical protein